MLIKNYSLEDGPFEFSVGEVRIRIMRVHGDRTASVGICAPRDMEIKFPQSATPAEDIECKTKPMVERP